MSTETGGGAETGGVRDGQPRLASAAELFGVRGLALLATAGLVFAFLVALYQVVDVVGDPSSLPLFVVASLVMATALARVLRVRTALTVGILLLGVGLGWYLLSLDVNPLEAQSRLVSDLLALLTGLSVLRLRNIELWAIGITPAPVFLTWYFAMRRRYVAAVGIGGTTLSFFILTGDIEPIVALSGVLGAAGAMGFGRLERHGGTWRGAEVVVILLAAMIVLSLTVSVVPGAGATQPFRPFGGEDENTVEASLVTADQRISIQGSIELSPEVRFSVRSNEGDYWRVGAYDRFTGSDWVQTGSAREYPGQLAGPPGRSRTITQNYEVQSPLNVMPAAWRPVSVSGDEDDEVMVTDMAGFTPEDTLEPGDSYRVTSRQPVATTQELRAAGTDYPDPIEERYTQLPASTPDRVERRTNRIAANADNPYDTARVIERWLENNREYSLDVDRPEGNVADAFLFEMDAGYCTYYATTMVTMLRTQGIPARMAVGYTPGERVAEDRWVVRGLNAHAWVEVYFEEYGWIRFDPTPASDRESAEQTRIEIAREQNLTGVDTNATGGSEWTPTPTITPEPLSTNSTANGSNQSLSTPAGPESVTPPPGAIRGTGSNQTFNGTNVTTTAPTTGGGDSGRSLPSRQETALGLLALVGIAIGARRSHLGKRAYRAVWLRYQPRDEPQTDIERAFQRLLYSLGERHRRSRRPDETVREYLDAIDADPRTREVAAIRERARYGGSVSEADADRAVTLVNDLVRGS
jgi:transglutaminase-like putative cysteine protease